MKLAWRELRRRPGRFMTATAILTLIASLLMLLGGLLDGLLNGATSAVLAQPGELIVYSADSEESFPRSRVDAEVIDTVRGVDGVEDAGGLGVVQLGARVPGRDDRDLLDVVVFGYELAPEGVPDAPADGTVYADTTLKAEGLEKGDEILLGQARTPVEIAGFIDRDLQYSGQGTLWGSPATWREALNANRPGSVLPDGSFQAIVVDTGSADPEALAERIDAATDDATVTLTTVDASEAIGGVKEQRSTFNQIIGVTVMIAVVVVALFFVLLTVERIAMYGVLKAIGARSRTLFAGVLLQALVVCLIAWTIGAALALVLEIVIPVGSIPYAISPARLAVSGVLLVIAAALGSVFSLRRVLRIDPAEAIG